MRCKNCGWPNKPNERVCVKCHAPLSADDDSIEREVGGSEGDASLSKTVCEENVFGQSMNEPYPSGNNQAETSEEKTKPCPKCGYPVRIGTEKCPNCKFPVSQGGGTSQRQPTVTVDNPKSEESHFRPTRMNPEENRTTGFRGTINPYMMNMEMEPTLY